jgi:RNA polymerase sigma factor (TIGR02999 family)
LKLWGGSADQRWDGRNHFFAAAAEAMRRLLVDQARRKASLKRGGNLARVDLEQAVAQWDVTTTDQEILDVHEALDDLAAVDPCAAHLVKLHYFSGFSVEESAELLGISRANGYRTWTYARTWLRAALGGDAHGDSTRA